MPHQLVFTPSSVSFERPFTAKSASAPLQIANKSSEYVIYSISLISTASVKYSTKPIFQVLGPNQGIETKIRRPVTEKDPHPRHIQDVICVESIGFPVAPSYSGAEALWKALQGTGHHISSWLVPIHLLPPSGSTARTSEAANSFGPQQPNQLDSGLFRHGIYHRFEPLSEDHTDGYFKLMYHAPVPTDSHAAIMECMMKYDDNKEAEPEKVAVKVLRDLPDNSYANDTVGPRSVIQRAKREYKLWASLHHENVAPLLGSCLYPRICFVTPFYVNGTVVNFVKSTNAEGLMRLDLMRDIVNGLQYMHDNRIIHGDLKQDNVVVDHNLTAVIIDFGLSMTVEEAAMTSNRAGNEQYLAKDVLWSAKKSKEADIYALGLLLLEVAIGGDANRKSAVTGQPERATYPELRDDSLLWPLMESCWNKDPDNRPDIGECVESLQNMTPSDIQGESAGL